MVEAVRVLGVAVLVLGWVVGALAVPVGNGTEHGVEKRMDRPGYDQQGGELGMEWNNKILSDASLGAKYLHWMWSDEGTDPDMPAQIDLHFNAFTRVGWDTVRSGLTPQDAASLQFLDGLDGHVEGKITDSRPMNQIVVKIDNDRWQKFVSIYRGTQATYTGVINNRWRVIVMDNYEQEWPQFLSDEDAARQPTGHRYPPVRDWNDLALIEYCKRVSPYAALSATVQRPPPAWFYLRPKQVPEDTRKTIQLLLTTWGITDLPVWPGITFPAGSLGHIVLLADPVVKNVVWLLLRTKTRFGNGVITSITVFDSGEVQNHGAKAGQPTGKVPSFLINVSRPAPIFDDAIKQNKEFASKQGNHAFTPIDQHGPFSSKEGPHWPSPMRPTINGQVIEPGAHPPPAHAAAAPQGQPGPAPQAGSDDHEIPDWHQFPGGPH